MPDVAPLEIRTDRSRISDEEKCARLRYWRYEHDGTGIEQPGQWLDPLIGTAVHNGVEMLLEGNSVDAAVGISQTTIINAKAAGPILIYRLGLHAEDDIKEGMLLAEAL